MSTWWYVILILVLVALGLFYVRYRRNSARNHNNDRVDSTLPSRDFAQERQTDRVSHMSDEDRTWEADSLARDQVARERKQTPPMQK